MTQIRVDQLSGNYDYGTYRQLIDSLFAEGKTTGPDQSPAMIEYTKLNIARMKRLDKTTRLEEDVVASLQAIDRPLTWLVLTEGWCGDAAQIVPVMQKMADQSDHIELRLLLRDEHPEIMDAFLTNGARSIPKLIILDQGNQTVLGEWGPRPEVVQNMVMAGKEQSLATTSDEGRSSIWNEVKIESQKWYARDKTRSTQREVLAAVRTALEQVDSVVS